MRLLKYSVMLLIAVTLISSSVMGTTLRGTVYNSTLDEMDDVLVIVYKGSEAIQKEVVQDSEYKFTLPSGEYLLTARTFDEEPMLGAQVEITIEDEGAFVSDLILEEMNETEFERAIEERDIELPDDERMNGDYLDFDFNLVIVGFGFLLFVIAAVAFFILKRYKKGAQEVEVKERERKKEEVDKVSEQDKEQSEEFQEGLDEESSKVLELIKSERRITQKEIRQKFDLSEAKISLIVTELQNQGYVKRVKKGRGNIIVYNNGVQSQSG